MLIALVLHTLNSFQSYAAATITLQRYKMSMPQCGLIIC